MRIINTLQCITIISVVTVACGGCVYVDNGGTLLGDCIRGTGAIQSEKRNLSEFDSVRMIGSATVLVTQGSPQQVTVAAQQNLLANLETRVSDDTMTIDPRRCYSSNEPITVYVTIPDIHALTIEGSGELQGKTSIVVDELSLTIEGSGDINLDVDTAAITTLIEGSGSTTLSGRTNAHRADIHGSGEIRSLNLISNRSNVFINGSGKADVYTTEALSVNVSGSGIVRYRGSPQDTSFTVDGSGDIEALE